MTRAQLPARADTVLVVPVFPARVRHFALALEEAGRLRDVVAGYAYLPGRPLERLARWGDRALRTRVTDYLRRRELPGIRSERCRRALTAEVFSSLRGLPLVRRLAGHDPDRRAYHAAIDRLAARRFVDGRTAWVFGRDGAAIHSFRRARQCGARRLYDLPTAHHATVQRIMEREEAEFPHVCQLPPTAVSFAPARNADREAELAEADHVIVGSGFVRDSLTRAGVPAGAITVLPTACDASWRPPDAPPPAACGNVVLHVGRLSLRKGTHRLLRAWKRLGAHRSHVLRLVGDMHLTPRFLADFQGCYEHLPRLPRRPLLEQYAAASLFVLPAAAEGFAAVILEALSCGVPVVASRNSGAEGFLEHGREGLLHDFGDDDALCAHLDWVLSHPAERAEMARAALAKAAGWTWEAYRRRFLEVFHAVDQRG